MRPETSLCFMIAFILLTALVEFGHAQITLDGSLVPAGSLIGPNYNISSDLGQTRRGDQSLHNRSVRYLAGVTAPQAPGLF